MTATRDPFACAAFLLGAFVLAGLAQTAWLSTRASRAFAIPLDAGLSWRGKRLFGANKTVRGVIVMVPATATSFALVAALIDPADAGLWPMSVGRYAVTGLVAGLGFMAGELPNSFFKRQLGIGPGEAATGRVLRALQLVTDRLDSGVGMLLALNLVVPTPWTTWLCVLAAGALVHWSFSVVLFWLGVKPRPA